MIYTIGYSYAMGQGNRQVHVNTIDRLKKELKLIDGIITFIDCKENMDSLNTESCMRTAYNILFYNARVLTTYNDKPTEFEKVFIDLVFSDKPSADYISRIYNKVKTEIENSGYAANDFEIRRAIARCAFIMGFANCMTYIDNDYLWYIIQSDNFIWKIRLRADRQKEKEFKIKINNKKEKNDYELGGR